MPVVGHAALSCSLSGVTTLNFGTPSPLDTANTDTSQSLTITCTAVKGDLPTGTGSTRTANLCVSYDNGTGGASAGGNRQLAGATQSALYDIYYGGFSGTHWGSRSGAPAGVVAQAFVTFTRPASGQVAPASTTVTTNARLFSGQNTLAPGPYSSTLNVTVEAFWNDVKSDCAAGGTVTATASSPQTVTATYRKECRVATVPDLSFGSIGFLTANVDAATDVAVTCTSTTPYSVGLDAGVGAGATTSSRKMTRTTAPASTVGYGLYRDSAHSLNWGNDTAGGSDTLNGSGSGSASSLRIYGRVPPQSTPEPGNYLDTVVVTVVF